MTIKYSLAVASVSFGGFLRLLLKWRGSIYKLILGELVLFATLFYGIALIYRYALRGEARERFEDVCLYFREYLDLIPITFVLGFYISLIISRWWHIYDNLSFVDNSAIAINTYVQGRDERGRMYRRNFARYLTLAQVLCFRCVSTSVKKRFPTIQHIVDAHLMTENEKETLESVSMQYGEFFQPLFWIGSLAMQARKEGRIHSDIHLKTIMDQVIDYRSKLGSYIVCDWISIPLVYTQVVTLATYAFFFTCLFGRQHIPSKDGKFFTTYYVPVFTFIQFFFYMGWLKVAEVMINPFGEDDDDLELNQLIDRNFGVGFVMTDELHSRVSKMEHDPQWNDIDPTIPYTEASAFTYTTPFLGSVADVHMPEGAFDWAHLGPNGTPTASEGWQGAVRKFTRALLSPTPSTPSLRHRIVNKISTIGSIGSMSRKSSLSSRVTSHHGDREPYHPIGETIKEEDGFPRLGACDNLASDWAPQFRSHLSHNVSQLDANERAKRHLDVRRQSQPKYSMPSIRPTVFSIGPNESFGEHANRKRSLPTIVVEHVT